MDFYRNRRATLQWAKCGPPLRGRSEKLSRGVAPLVRAPSPARATLLARQLFGTILAQGTYRYRP